MRLEDYLQRTGQKPSEFAKKLGREPSTITRLLPGENGEAPKRKPGWRLIDEIARATDGAVTANDFIGTPSEIHIAVEASA